MRLWREGKRGSLIRSPPGGGAVPVLDQAAEERAGSQSRGAQQWLTTEA